MDRRRLVASAADPRGSPSSPTRQASLIGSERSSAQRCRRSRNRDCFAPAPLAFRRPCCGAARRLQLSAFRVMLDSQSTSRDSCSVPPDACPGMPRRRPRPRRRPTPTIPSDMVSARSPRLGRVASQQAHAADASVGTRASWGANFRVVEWTTEHHSGQTAGSSRRRRRRLREAARGRSCESPAAPLTCRLLLCSSRRGSRHSFGDGPRVRRQPPRRPDRRGRADPGSARRDPRHAREGAANSLSAETAAAERPSRALGRELVVEEECHLGVGDAGDRPERVAGAGGEDVGVRRR